MKNVSVETISETGVSKSNPELSDKQKKRSTRLENDLTNQNGKVDEAVPSGEGKEDDTEKSISGDQVLISENDLSTLPEESCKEPGVTLHHTDPVLSTREDSIADANSNGSSKKKPRRRGKKKKNTSCEEKTLDDAETNTNEEYRGKSNTSFEVEGSKSTSIEEKTVASVVISSCLKDKDNTAEQREGTSVKLSETEKSISRDQVLLSENCLSALPAESCKQDSVSCEEPGATLHHTDPVLSTREGSTPDGSRKKPKKRGKKKKDSSCAEKTTNEEEQVHPPKNTLPNSMVQEGSHEHTQDSCEKPGAAQLCTDPNLSTPEDSRPDATMMTGSQERKKEGKSDINMLKESGVDIHSTNAEVSEISNTISEAEGSKSTSLEDKTVASVVINSCVKAKDNTMEQQEGTSVKLNETVSQTQSPKAKKKKKRKTKTMEVSDPLGNTLATSSMQSRPVECMENNDDNAGPELMSSLASKRGNSAIGEESGFQNLGKTKEKETDENTEVSEVVLGGGLCEVISKQKCEKKTSSADHKTADMAGEDTTSKTEKSATTEKSGVQNPGKRKEMPEDVNVESNQDALREEGVSDVGCKRKKRKKNKNKICESVANMDSESVLQCLSYHSKENCDGNADREIASKDLGNKIEDSATERKSVQNVEITKREKEDMKGEDDQDALGAEGVSMSEVKTKKKKKKKSDKKMNSLDLKTSNMEEKKDDVALSRDDEEVPEIHREKLETSLSSFDLVHNSAIGEESGFQNLGKTKEKETDENTEVNEDVLGGGLSEKKKKKKKKKKTSSANMVGQDTTSKTEKSATTEKSGVQNPGKRKERPEDANVESNEDALRAEGVSDIGRKKKKRKKNKNKSCESVANMDSESVQCLPSHSNKEGVENCDGNADREIASKDLASKIEDSTTEGKSVQNVENTKKEKEDKKGEDDQGALGAEGVSLTEVKTKKKKKKKKKNSVDLKTANTEEKKDDVSVPRDDEEVLETDREKRGTSLSSFDLVDNNVAEGIASPETGDLPRCSCEGQHTKKLVVFDLNGILADIVQGDTGEFVPDGKISYRSVFRRPFVARFLDVCFEKFEVGIWSSRRVGLDYMINVVMRNQAKNLLFCFDQNVCTTTTFKTQEDRRKPVFLKDLRRVWNRFGTCFTCGKRKYDKTNTLLVDDSPYKSLCNPPHTGIFPSPYQYTDREDCLLGPEGELRKYLERLADAENVQKFVEENPFGQTAITETHESWEYYSMVIEAYK